MLAMKEIIKKSDVMGIKYLTVYAFSTENWSRPQSEVKTLMNLLRTYMRTSLQKCAKNNVRIRVLGDRSKLDEDLIEAIDDLERDTKNNTGLQFQIAINYGGRDDIRRGVMKIAEKVRSGELDPASITEETVSENLDTADIPDPDLLIRTSGELRISNFLIWQCAYTEYYFTDVLWPEFNKEELQKAVDAYMHRERRMGGLMQ